MLYVVCSHTSGTKALKMGICKRNHHPVCALFILEHNECQNKKEKKEDKRHYWMQRATESSLHPSENNTSILQVLLTLS